VDLQDSLEMLTVAKRRQQVVAIKQ